MGFWERIGRGIRRIFGGGNVEPEPSAPPQPPSTPPSPSSSAGGGGGIDTEDFGGYGDNEGDGDSLPDPYDLPFDFSIAGFLPLGGDYNADYVNTEGYPMDPDGIDWPDVDYVVVHIIEPNGSDYYTTIVGPFDDYDDWYEHLASWWEEGSI